MNEQDLEFFEKVVKTYHQLDESIRETAHEMQLSRTKVRKILITMGEIESPITDKALPLLGEGKSQTEVAEILGISTATLSTYLPYGDRICGREDKTKNAIRTKGYKERQSVAAQNQVNKVEKKEYVMEVEEKDLIDKRMRVLRLHMELKDTRDRKELKDYGKVKESISRDVLVSANYTLHALHYVIQKLFGWQNSHLHHFEFAEETENELIGDSYSGFCKLVGHIFRPAYDSQVHMDDIYWDDDYEEGRSFKSWLKEKYTSPFRYYGNLEHYIVAQMVTENFCDANKEIQLPPSFEEYLNGKTECTVVNPRSATFAQMNNYFESGLGEIIERLGVGDVLGLNTVSAQSIKDEAEEKYKTYQENAREFTDLLELADKADEHKKKADRARVPINKFAEFDKASKMMKQYEEKMASFLSRTDEEPYPITDTIIYKYDSGDGWEVAVTVIEEYDVSGDDHIKFCRNGGEEVDDVLGKKLYDALWNGTPYCVAADGLPVFDDIGGVDGYCDFLVARAKKEDDGYFAREMGWTGRMSKPENML